MPMIELQGIYKVYDDGHEALKDIHLTFEDGDINVIIGPSGCGKTTTMKLINRLIQPSKGNILIDGKDTSTLSSVELRRSIGYVIQSVGLFPHMTIAQNVGVVPKLLKWEKHRIDERTDELLQLVGLEPDTYRHRFPSELSGGQQQRIGVIRALAAEPSIILVDEPFSALDPISREQLQDELINLQKTIKKTIVFVTHDMDEALKIADNIVLMKDGEVVQQGSPENILRHPANEFVESFIGEKRLRQANNMSTVQDVMRKNPVRASDKRGLAEAMKMMERKQVDTLLIVDKSDELEGYVTIYDVLGHFREEKKKLADIVKPFEHIVKLDTPLTEAIQLMNDYNLPYIPVTNDKEVLQGLVTRGSIVGHIGELYPPEEQGVL